MDADLELSGSSPTPCLPALSHEFEEFYFLSLGQSKKYVVELHELERKRMGKWMK